MPGKADSPHAGHQRAGTLILVRHGQSETNAANIFTGILDPPLTQRGIHEAREVGKRLRSVPIPPIDHAYTSPLQRASSSLSHILETYLTDSDNSSPPPVTVDPALNERDYGKLNGHNKAKVAEEYGAEQVNAWRRSYRAVPPGGESLEMTVERAWAYYCAEIQTRLERGECILVVSHGNTLRGLCMKLDGLDEDQVLRLTLGTGALRIYRIDGNGQVIDRQIFAVHGLEGGPQ
ncbi:phosphoglyceromutase [Rhodotorula sp. JG-1b]|nr:phosphoglyceromutase [Rhodotorula sp. JG-1b]